MNRPNPLKHRIAGALLLGPMTVSELSRLLGATRANVWHAAQELRARGEIEATAGRGVRKPYRLRRAAA